MKYKTLLLSLQLLFLLNIPLWAQTPRPEQDCITPLNVCSKFVNLSYQYNGFGNHMELIPEALSCRIDERDAVWLRLDIVSSGMLGFNIIPTSEEHDWDFMLFDLTNNNCYSIESDPSLIVACNTRGLTFPTPVTGMNDGSWPQDEPMMHVDSGEVYFLLIRFYKAPVGTDTIWSPALVDFSIGSCGICSVEGENRISGKVFLDTDENCLADSNETKLGNIMVKLEPVEASLPSVYTLTDEHGNYQIVAPSHGQFRLSIINPLTTDIVCRPNHDLVEIPEGGQLSGQNFAVKNKEDCADILVRNSTSGLVRCFRNTRTINVCNQGNLPAENLVLRLEYDPVLTPVSLPDGMAKESENLYQINLPPVPPFECIIYKLTDSVSCSAVNVWEACVNALIEPTTRCSNTLNDQFELDLESSCVNGYQLKITNTSNLDMGAPLKLSIYGDLNLLQQSQIQLLAGEELSFNLEDAGLNDYSAVISEGSEILLTNNIHGCQETQDLASYWRSLSHSFSNYGDSLSCETILASYDPNDKTGYPFGLGPENIILRDQKMKYKIRFQNTGTGMAYNVVIKDTLPGYLDESTIRIGNASHRYEFHASGGIITFKFPEIFLPDSASDPAGSNGFIEFYIDQIKENPQVYQISNRAAIYFDYNDPVITKPALHNIEPVKLSIQTFNHEPVGLYPNPCDVGFFLEDCPSNTIVSIFGVDGKLIEQEKTGHGPSFIPTQHLQEGLFVVRLDIPNNISLFQKLIISHR